MNANPIDLLYQLDRRMARIETSIEALKNATSASQIELGFTDIPLPRSKYIYVRREGNNLWYMLGENDEHIFPPKQVLTGKIKNLTIVALESQFNRRKTLTTKVDLLIDCGVESYIIRSGIETGFTKGLLFGLYSATPEQLAKPISVAVSEGEQSVLCRLYDPFTKKRIFSEGIKEIHHDKMLAAISKKLPVLHKAAEGEDDDF